MEKIENFLSKYENKSLITLKIAMGLVFVYFGYTGVTNPEMWSSDVPAFTNFFIDPNTLVQLHGFVEIILGALLISQIKTQIVSIVLSLMLFQIITVVGFGPVFMRDLGLLASLLFISTKK